MKFNKIAKYLVMTMMAGAIAFTPITAAIVAASGEDAVPTPAELEEIARQERLEQEYQELVAEATNPVNQTVAGVKSQAKGYYLAKSVQGVAMTPADPGSNAFLKVYDADKKLSHYAMDTANAVAALLGGTVGPCVDVEYGVMENGRFHHAVGIANSVAVGSMSIGIPENFRTDGATYSLVAVYPGGEYRVFENVSPNPAVVTVDVTEAPFHYVMYALVKH